MSNSKKFQEVKAEILRRAESENACLSQYGRAKNSETVNELLEVVKDNFEWCWSRKIVDIDLLNLLGNDDLWSNGIYTTGEHDLTFSEDVRLIFLGNSQATVKTWGSSQATVETRESSQATVKTRGSSIIRNLTTRKIYVPKNGWEIIVYEEPGLPF